MKWSHLFNWGAVFGGLLLLIGILIPSTSGPHGPRAEIMAARSQYSKYVTALQLFRGEYGYYPTVFDGRSQVNISTYPEAEQFIEALSGRTLSGDRSSAYGNTRGIAFHSFSESELTRSKDLGYWQIVDRMGNTNIVVCIDHDGDGFVEVVEDGVIKQIRTQVVIYTIPKEGERAIRLW
jgi:hypothetical protein